MALDRGKSQEVTGSLCTLQTFSENQSMILASKGGEKSGICKIGWDPRSVGNARKKKKTGRGAAAPRRRARGAAAAAGLAGGALLGSVKHRGLQRARI